LAVFVRCVLAYLDEEQEMLVSVAMEETSQDPDVQNVLDTVLTITRFYAWQQPG
jgi:hypothetical protein